MDGNPYEAPATKADRPSRRIRFPWEWVWGGFLAGVCSGPFVGLLLLWSMHEDHDPPLAELMGKVWPGLAIFSIPMAAIGTWLGAVLALVVTNHRRKRQAKEQLDRKPKASNPE